MDENLGIDTKGRTTQHNQIGILSRFKRAQPISEIKHLGGTEREGAQCADLSHTAAHCQRAFAQQEAGVDDVIVRIEGDLHTGSLEDQRDVPG